MFLLVWYIFTILMLAKYDDYWFSGKISKDARGKKEFVLLI